MLLSQDGASPPWTHLLQWGAFLLLREPDGGEPASQGPEALPAPRAGLGALGGKQTLSLSPLDASAFSKKLHGFQLRVTGTDKADLSSARCLLCYLGQGGSSSPERHSCLLPRRGTLVQDTCHLSDVSLPVRILVKR